MGAPAGRAARVNFHGGGMRATTPTDAELSAMKLIAQGKTAKEAAQELGLSPWTIKDQIKSATKRIGARNAPHAVAISIMRGWITREDLG